MDDLAKREAAVAQRESDVAAQEAAYANLTAQAKTDMNAALALRAEYEKRMAKMNEFIGKV